MDVIAIDGLAGSGKSTVAARLAKRLGMAHLDTGASFRMAALLSMQRGIEPTNEDGVLGALRGCTMEYELGKSILDGKDVSDLIRQEAVSSFASQIAVHKEIRKFLKNWQRNWVVSHGRSVVEGRDIGTIVFPNAKLKVFLEADNSVRASRRNETTKQEIDIRDMRDLSRENAPVQKAEDAFVIDTTNLGITEVEELVVSYWQIKLG